MRLEVCAFNFVPRILAEHRAVVASDCHTTAAAAKFGLDKLLEVPTERVALLVSWRDCCDQNLLLQLLLTINNIGGCGVGGRVDNFQTFIDLATVESRHSLPGHQRT